jgi:hypothetical protein|tara:strand:- start:381 stop:635 length:255 start_codon:yes stop_codon:yes gene_type:complete
MATTLNSLQDCLKTAYDSGTDSINVQQPMLTSLGDKTLVLMDFDVSPQELPLLQKFLNTKQVCGLEAEPLHCICPCCYSFESPF